MWDRVVGQERAVGLLQQAAERPAHAYLLVGPRGSGVEDAARCFAAALVAPDGNERAWSLALRDEHPDVVIIDPNENQIRLEAAQQLIDEAHRSPIEGDRKVIVMLGSERLQLNDASANKLLKTLEEAPPRSHIVLVTDRPTALLPTIRSRCQRVDFAFLAEPTVRQALVGSGLDEARAALIARLAGGRLDRARRMAEHYGTIRDAFAAVPERLDGSGAAVARAADVVGDALKDAVAGLESTHQQEEEALTAELEDAGYQPRVAKARTKQLQERHVREHRRARTDALYEGITAIETVYRDALAGTDAPRLNTDRDPLVVDPRACAEALDACRAARQALGEFNPSEGLLLEHLFLQLPGVVRS
jgi:DNA polymerase-3 subunit delta'